MTACDERAPDLIASRPSGLSEQDALQIVYALEAPPFVYKPLWDIRHWWSPVKKRSEVARASDWCICLICTIKRHGILWFVANVMYILRIAKHQYRISQGLETCRCVGKMTENCMYTKGYVVPLDIQPESFKLCRGCSSLAKSCSNTKAIVSDDGLVVLSSKRHIQDHAYKGCPLCRIIMDSLIAHADNIFRPLSGLPLLGKIVLGFRAPVPKIFAKDDRVMFDVMEVALLTQIGKIGWWPRDDTIWAPQRLLLLSIAAEPDDAAAQDFFSRPVDADVASDKSIAQAMEWFQSCVDGHEACLPKPQHGPLPTRVVDVNAYDTTDRMKLCLTEGENGRYTALSYSWGQRDQPVMTKRHNIDRWLTDGFPTDELPQTILDAIKVTRRLGIQYLWVDVLCIIQDSSTDKDQEIRHLQDYFANSYVTIVAASASSCESGFLQPRAPSQDKFESLMVPDRAPPTFKLPWLCRDGRTGNVLVQPWKEYDYLKEPISSRAWTLEERLLSTRMLVFTSTQLMWMCQTGNKNAEISMMRHKNPLAYSRLPDKIFTAGKTGETAPSLSEIDLAEMHRYWRIIVQDYTTRNLTDPRDKLRAISGIAAKIKIAAPHLVYLAGVWCPLKAYQHEISSELLWTIPKEFKACYQTEDDFVRRPSFAWSSVTQPVIWERYHIESRISPFSKVTEVLNVRFNLSSPRLEFGPVTEAVLTVRGPTLEVLGCRGFGDGFYIDGDMLEFFDGKLDTRFGSRRTLWDRIYEDSSMPVRLLKMTPQEGLIVKSTDNGHHYRIGVFSTSRYKNDDSKNQEIDQWSQSFNEKITHLV